MGDGADENSYSSTLAACASSGSWQAALDILGYMVRCQLRPRDFDFSAAMRACSVGQRIDLSLELLGTSMNSRAVQGRLCYDTAMQECSRAKLWQMCLQLLQEMPRLRLSPTLVSYDTVINSCENSGNWHLALRLLGVMPARALVPDLRNFYSAVGVCAHTGQWQAVLRLLLVLPPKLHPGADIFQHAILGCDDACKWEAALTLLASMPKVKVTPDEGCFDAAIRACATVGQWILALNVFDKAVSLDKARASTLSFMLTACRTGAQWELALQLLFGPFQSDLDCFDAAISSCRVAAAWRESVSLLAEMRRRSLRPDAHSTAAASHACTRAGEWQLGLSLLEPFLEISDSQDCTREVMHACGLGLCWQGAVSLLLRSEMKDINDWNFVISACQKSKQWQATLDLFRTLVDARIHPDGRTYRSVIKSSLTWSGSEQQAAGRVLPKSGSRSGVARGAVKTQGSSSEPRMAELRLPYPQSPQSTAKVLLDAWRGRALTPSLCGLEDLRMPKEASGWPWQHREKVKLRAKSHPKEQPCRFSGTVESESEAIFSIHSWLVLRS
ncbi:PTAC2 [Symbiodinium pilosum]|uniref:PTAC2 protein n=1 Tax=Symbiodinium pilosum TaxID=2952 RepID=A0A812XWW3_SYMPI|nr:PTAC2 [Symbiodinium pilosum]